MNECISNQVEVKNNIVTEELSNIITNEDLKLGYK